MEKIEGKNIAVILKTIKKDKTLIKLRIPNKDYECLTIITNVSPNKKKNAFMIDSPMDFRSVFGGLNDIKIKKIMSILWILSKIAILTSQPTLASWPDFPVQP